MKKTFNEPGTFQSFYKACEWLKENGYSWGSMCGSLPIGILKGDWGIAKWRNLSDEEIDKLDGKMTSGNWREGIVTVEIYNP